MDESCPRHRDLLRLGGSRRSAPELNNVLEDESVTNELCSCGNALRKRKEKDWFTWAEKVVYFCGSCHSRYTECGLQKLNVLRTPVEELIRQGQFDTITVDRLRAFLQEKGLASSGSKDDLLTRASAACSGGNREPRERLRVASAEVEERVKAKAATKACMETSLVLSGIDPKKTGASRFRCSANFFGQRHEPHLRENFGAGCPITKGELFRVRDADVALGMTAPSESAAVVVCSRKSGAVYAILDQIHVGSVNAPVFDYWHHDRTPSHSYFRCDSQGCSVPQQFVSVEGVGQVPAKWTEIYSDTETVTVLQREGFWSDVERDFDKSFPKRNYYDPEPKGWGFTISRQAWTAAWEALIEKVREQRIELAENARRVAAGDVRTQRELEDFLGGCNDREALVTALSAFWGLRPGTKLRMPSGRGANHPRPLSDFTVLALKRLMQEKFAEREVSRPTVSAPRSCALAADPPAVEDDEDSDTSDDGSSNSDSSNDSSTRSDEPPASDTAAVAQVEEVEKLFLAAQRRGKDAEAARLFLCCVQDRRPVDRLGGKIITLHVLRATAAKLRSDILAELTGLDLHAVDSAYSDTPSAKRARIQSATLSGAMGEVHAAECIYDNNAASGGA